jgi:hypothetical protein
VQLLAVLGLLWTMRGEHLRLVTLARAVAEAVRGWLPPPDLANAARAAVAITLNNSLMIGGGEADGPLIALLRQLGPDPGGNVYLSGLVRVLLAYGSAGNGSFPHRFAADAADWTGTPGFPERLAALAADPDRHTAAAASQWLGHERENVGDPAGAIEAAQRVLALVRDEDGPWSRAMPHGLLAELTMHVGTGCPFGTRVLLTAGCTRAPSPNGSCRRAAIALSSGDSATGTSAAPLGGEDHPCIRRQARV